jgi:pimeloyl-ACP methyl ester carboxylesterase
VTTLVLVHGGSVTSRAWDPLLPLLRTPTATVDLPGRRHRPADLSTLCRADWERSAAADVEALGLDDVVLVGHSSGGYVIPGVASLLPSGVVRRLVFVAANCPAEGQSPVESMAEKLRGITLANRENLAAQAVGRTIGDLRPGEAPIDTELEIVEVDLRMGVEAPGQLYEPMTWEGVPDVARTYVRATRDRIIPADHALVMAANAGAAEVVDLDAGHDVVGDAPEALAALLDRIAATPTP